MLRSSGKCFVGFMRGLVIPPLAENVSRISRGRLPGSGISLNDGYSLRSCVGFLALDKLDRLPAHCDFRALYGRLGQDA